MLARLITTDTRIKYLVSNSLLFDLPYRPVSSRVSSTLDNSLGKSCLVDGNPETCWTSQQARSITSQSDPLHHLIHHHTGSSAIHPTSLSISRHSQTNFANFPRRVRWHCLRCDHPISRCHQLARTHTNIPRGRKSCTGVRSHRRRASERNQADFWREFGLFWANNGIQLNDRGASMGQRVGRHEKLRDGSQWAHEQKKLDFVRFSVLA